jgi:hypothetical protein
MSQKFHLGLDLLLCAFMERHRWRLVPSTAITAALRASSATDIGHTLWLPAQRHLCPGPTGRRCHDPPSWQGGLRHHPIHRPVAFQPDPLLPARLSAADHAMPREYHDTEQRIPAVPDTDH